MYRPSTEKVQRNVDQLYLQISPNKKLVGHVNGHVNYLNASHVVKISETQVCIKLSSGSASSPSVVEHEHNQRDPINTDGSVKRMDVLTEPSSSSSSRGIEVQDEIPFIDDLSEINSKGGDLWTRSHKKYQSRKGRPFFQNRDLFLNRYSKKLRKEMSPDNEINRNLVKIKNIKPDPLHSQKNGTLLQRSKSNYRIGATRARQEWKATLTVGIVLFTFIGCWLPFFVLALYRPLLGNGAVPGWISSTALWLGYTNSMLNPIIYGILHRDFRRTFKNIILCNYSKLRNWS